MNTSHTFLLCPGVWQGEGTISLSFSPEMIPFVTKWRIVQKDETSILCEQLVVLEQQGESFVNRYTLSEVTPLSFAIEWKSPYEEQAVLGRGHISPEAIDWEWEGSLQGKEHFLRKEGDLYLFQSSFQSGSSSSFSRQVSGEIWRLEK